MYVGLDLALNFEKKLHEQALVQESSGSSSLVLRARYPAGSCQSLDFLNMLAGVDLGWPSNTRPLHDIVANRFEWHSLPACRACPFWPAGRACNRPRPDASDGAGVAEA